MGFSFQGIHSKEKKLKARITGYPMLPSFRNNTESIPGRSGILDFGMEYSERIIPVECSVFPEQDFSALVHRIDEINGWLNPYRGVQPLIFDEYPDRYFMARLNTEISMEKVSRTAGTFSLEFICPDPFGYAVEDEVFSIAKELCACSLNGKELKQYFEEVKDYADDFEYELSSIIDEDMGLLYDLKEYDLIMNLLKSSTEKRNTKNPIINKANFFKIIK